MTKKVTSIKLTNELKTAVLQDMKLKGITSFNKYVELALIHEMNRKSPNGSIYELEQLINLISERIHEIKGESKEEPEKINNDIQGHLDEIQRLQNSFGHVTEGVIKLHAKETGLTFEELLKKLTEANINVIIEK